MHSVGVWLGVQGTMGWRPGKWYRVCEGITEVIVYFMIVFSPWAFGTTQRWSTWTMNAAGYALGALLAAKWGIRRWGGYRPYRWDGEGQEHRGARRVTAALAGMTLLLLGYCLVSALNARADYVHVMQYFEYYDYIPWLPHSYDRTYTWLAFWQWVALACSFWAVWDWVRGKTRAEVATGLNADGTETRDQEPTEENGGRRPKSERRELVPARLRRLLWVICLNGTLLAVEGILQRLSGSNRLLWLVTPHINYGPENQFGPYAYRSNGAQYLNLVWPLCLGFWWTLRQQWRLTRRHSQRLGEAPYVVLLPCTLVVCAAPMVSTSRGGSLVAICGMAIALLLVLIASRSRNWRALLAALGFFLAVVGLGGVLGWEKLGVRFQTMLKGDFGSRQEIYGNARQMAQDFGAFGSGPNTFSAVYQLYRSDPKQVWQSYLHDDWLETRITLGWVGFAMVLAALGLAVLRCVFRQGIQPPWFFTSMIGLALAGCLLHAKFDFPFQIYSILFLFLVECSLLHSLGRR